MHVMSLRSREKGEKRMARGHMMADGGSLPGLRLGCFLFAASLSLAESHDTVSADAYAAAQSPMRVRQGAQQPKRPYKGRQSIHGSW